MICIIQKSAMFPEILKTEIWHTTSVDRFKGILTIGGILPEPPIPDKDRWGGCGSTQYPFVRSIGGVSLFDFSDFDEVAYEQKHPLSMWKTFVPCLTQWDEAIWIELNRSAIKDNFIDGKALIERWKRQGNLGRKVMPIIEAAHIGPVPISAFHRVIIFRKLDQTFAQVQMPIYR